MNRRNSAFEVYAQLGVKIGQERLRQAHYSFNIALASSVAFTAISLLGVGMLWFGKVSEGTLIASSGMLSSIGCMWLAEDANYRLDRIMNELLDES